MNVIRGEAFRGGAVAAAVERGQIPKVACNAFMLFWLAFLLQQITPGISLDNR